jgi:hypothetical protein
MERSELFLTGGKDIGSSMQTELRAEAEKEILFGNNTVVHGIKDTINNIALSNYEILSAYVRSNGDIPLIEPAALFIQALFIRLTSVFYTCHVSGVDYNTAIIALEQEESDSLERRLPDCGNILPADVIAAMNIVTGDLETYVSDKDDINFTGLYDLIGDMYSSNVAYSTIIDSNISTSKGVLDSVVDAVKNVVDNIIDHVKESAGDAATDTVGSAIKRNIPLIIGIALLIGLIIFVSVYAGKKASKS